MTWQLIWLPAASEEFCCAVHDLNRHNPAAAARLHSNVDRRLKLAVRHPMLFKRSRASTDPAVREFYVPPHRVFYRVVEREKAVVAPCVWHGARRDPLLPD